MPELQHGLSPIDRQRSVLMWDMAGTLIPFDPVSGKAQPMPGAADFLPELGREFRQVVTTGDETASARNLLREFELLDHFEEVFGDLFHPRGKPYGAILRTLGATADHSLAIGDRLGADLPADTGDLVTILINQDTDRVGAGMVAFCLHVLRKQNAPTFAAAFDSLLESAFPEPKREGPLGGGTVTRACLRNDGFDYRMWLYTPGGLPDPRRVIVL